MKKVREALKALILDSEVGTRNVFEAKSSSDKTAPCVLCGAENAVEDPAGTGNFWVDAVVMVKSVMAPDVAAMVPPADPPAVVDPKPASDEITLAVFQLLEVDDLAARLTAILEDFTVMGLGEGKSFEEGAEEDCWVEVWRRRIYCCASDLS